MSANVDSNANIDLIEGVGDAKASTVPDGATLLKKPSRKNLSVNMDPALIIPQGNFVTLDIIKNQDATLVLNSPRSLAACIYEGIEPESLIYKKNKLTRKPTFSKFPNMKKEDIEEVEWQFKEDQRQNLIRITAVTRQHFIDSNSDIPSILGNMSQKSIYSNRNDDGSFSTTAAQSTAKKRENQVQLARVRLEKALLIEAKKLKDYQNEVTVSKDIREAKTKLEKKNMDKIKQETTMRKEKQIQKEKLENERATQLREMQKALLQRQKKIEEEQRIKLEMQTKALREANIEKQAKRELFLKERKLREAEEEKSRIYNLQKMQENVLARKEILEQKREEKNKKAQERLKIKNERIQKTLESERILHEQKLKQYLEREEKERQREEQLRESQAAERNKIIANAHMKEEQRRRVVQAVQKNIEEKTSAVIDHRMALEKKAEEVRSLKQLDNNKKLLYESLKEQANREKLKVVQRKQEIKKVLIEQSLQNKERKLYEIENTKKNLTTTEQKLHQETSIIISRVKEIITRLKLQGLCDSQVIAAKIKSDSDLNRINTMNIDVNFIVENLLGTSDNGNPQESQL